MAKSLLDSGRMDKLSGCRDKCEGIVNEKVKWLVYDYFEFIFNHQTHLVDSFMCKRDAMTCSMK